MGRPALLFAYGEAAAGPRRERRLGYERGAKEKGGVAQRVWDMALPLAQELGLSLWDLQFVKEGADWFLAHLHRQGGGRVHRRLRGHDPRHRPGAGPGGPIPQEYLLEVSSPGLERKLTRPQHFAAYVGKPVRARLIRPLETGERGAVRGAALRTGGRQPV